MRQGKFTESYLFQASDGRQLALSLQDDLTDTEVNILSRLREDKHVLEDRLAALEHQYNCDIAKVRRLTW